LSAIEFFALLTICFASVTLVLEEMESRTIYLILTRPVSRGLYLTGRYFGLLSAVFIGMAIMAAIHLGLLFLNGWEFTWRYPLALMLSAEKIAIIGSLALFISLFSTSAISSLSFTVFIWILGHFSIELNFIAGKVHNVLLKILLKAAYYISPNLQYFNLRDFWDVPSIVGPWIAVAVGYGAVYSALCLALSLWLFTYKEF
jgi:ABC-type transport system involved in multi-copper enzyme maturation permease subunit